MARKYTENDFIKIMSGKYYVKDTFRYVVDEETKQKMINGEEDGKKQNSSIKKAKSVKK